MPFLKDGKAMKGLRLRLLPALLLQEKQKSRWEEHEERVAGPPGIPELESCSPERGACELQ